MVEHLYSHLQRSSIKLDLLQSCHKNNRPVPTDAALETSCTFDLPFIFYCEPLESVLSKKFMQTIVQRLSTPTASFNFFFFIHRVSMTSNLFYSEKNGSQTNNKISALD